MVLIRLALYDHLINNYKFIVLKLARNQKQFDFLDTVCNFKIVKSKYPNVWMRKDIDQSSPSVYVRRA